MPLVELVSKLYISTVETAGTHYLLLFSRDKLIKFYWPFLQVLQERGESTSRHGRATFSVLLFQVSFENSVSGLRWHLVLK
jgi:hypothetical protein